MFTQDELGLLWFSVIKLRQSDELRQNLSGDTDPESVQRITDLTALEKKCKEAFKASKT